MDAYSYHTSAAGSIQKESGKSENNTMTAAHEGESAGGGEDFFMNTGNSDIKKKDVTPPKYTEKHVEELLEPFQIEELFGKVFGIERVQLLHKTDRLQDVIEKLQLIPESKLIYAEENHTLPEDASYTVHNTLTLGDLLTYLCPSPQENM